MFTDVFHRIFSEKREQLEYLQKDYLGFHFNTISILHFIEIVVIVFYLFFLMRQLGKKVRVHFFSFDNPRLNFFIDIALGHILIGTYICLLGILSLLTTFVLTISLLILSFIAFVPLRSVHEDLLFLRRYKKKLTLRGEYFWTKIGIVFIVFAVFLRLLPPDIGADALDYHTTYPRLYLSHHTMMLEPKGTESFIAIPQLSESVYVITQFFGFPDASKFIHFLFYVLCILLLWQLARQKSMLFRFAPLFFAASPLAIHIAPSAYGDFQGVYFLLLSVILLSTQKVFLMRTVSLSGVLFGGVLATKIWGLVFFPVFFLYFYIVLRKNGLFMILKTCIFFSVFSLGIPAIWYLRSFLLTGNLLYFPVEISKAVPKSLIERLWGRFSFNLESKKWYLTDYLFLSYIGIPFLLFSFTETKKLLKKIPFLLFSLFTLLLFLLLPSEFSGRYSLPGYAIISVLLSVGFLRFLSLHKMIRITVGAFFGLLALYYLCNSLLILPYGLGLTNQDAYLTRAFGGNGTTYYDFEHKFSQHIDSNETVATYGFSPMYYADFPYKNIFYFVDEKRRLLIYLQKERIAKLLVRGGDIHWMCTKEKITDCNTVHFTLLTKYDSAQQYLYSITY